MQGGFLISSEFQEVAGVLRCLDAIDFKYTHIYNTYNTITLFIFDNSVFA